MTRNGNIVTTVGALVVGAAAGYVAGVLCAPASGRETRRRLARRLEREAEDIACTARERFNETREAVSDALHGH